MLYGWTFLKVLLSAAMLHTKPSNKRFIISVADGFLVLKPFIYLLANLCGRD